MFPVHSRAHIALSGLSGYVFIPVKAVFLQRCFQCTDLYPCQFRPEKPLGVASAGTENLCDLRRQGARVPALNRAGRYCALNLMPEQVLMQPIKKESVRVRAFSDRFPCLTDMLPDSISYSILSSVSCSMLWISVSASALTAAQTMS